MPRCNVGPGRAAWTRACDDGGGKDGDAVPCGPFACRLRSSSAPRWRRGVPASGNKARGGSRPSGTQGLGAGRSEATTRALAFEEWWGTPSEAVFKPRQRVSRDGQKRSDGQSRPFKGDQGHKTNVRAHLISLASHHHAIWKTQIIRKREGSRYQSK